MKKTTMLVIFLFGYLICFSQTGDQIKKLIDSSIKMTYEDWKAAVISGNGDTSKLKKIYLFDQLYRPLSYLGDSSYKLFHFIYPDRRHNHKIIKKGITAWVIFPKLTRDSITVWITDCKTRYEGRKTLAFIVHAESKAIFQYNCESRIWEKKYFRYWVP